MTSGLLSRTGPGLLSGAEEEEVLRFGPLHMDVARRAVEVGGEPVELTKTEFSLLELLLRNPTRVLARATINRLVWGYEPEVRSNSLGIHVGYLRRKLEAGGGPRLIQTVRGVGYVLREPRR